MDTLRKPFQGVWNIVRFNWHFYAVAVVLCLPLLWWHVYLAVLLLPLLVSLSVSYFVYDRSNVYNLPWAVGSPGMVVNIHAGFDETSALLAKRFADASLRVFDFYDPALHTEVSIRRARKAYPPFEGTRHIQTRSIPLPDSQADQVFVTLSAHEIREESERSVFFTELCRILRPGGRVFVTEHLRDLPNFLAYNVGFFHFLPRSAWYKAFQQGGLTLFAETKITPFITTFILEKHGIPS